MANDIIKNMTNLADSGQDQFVDNYTELARTMLYEQGVSMKYLTSNKAEYILAKAVIDLIDVGEFSTTTLSMIATLRVNHPHGEDDNV